MKNITVTISSKTALLGLLGLSTIIIASLFTAFTPPKPTVFCNATIVQVKGVQTAIDQAYGRGQRLKTSTAITNRYGETVSILLTFEGQ